MGNPKTSTPTNEDVSAGSDVEYAPYLTHPKALTEEQIKDISHTVADALQHEGNVPETLTKDVGLLSALYKGYKNAYNLLHKEVSTLRAIGNAVQAARIKDVVVEAMQHEGEIPNDLVADVEKLSNYYKGYKNAYNVLNVEVGHFRAYSAPYVRPDKSIALSESKPSIFLVTLPKSGLMAQMPDRIPYSQHP